MKNLAWRRRGVFGAAALALALGGCAHDAPLKTTDTETPQNKAQYAAAFEKELESQRAGWRENGTPYLGLSLRDEATLGGTLIGWVSPGPLRLHGEKSAVLSRGDVLLSVDGKPMLAAELKPYVMTKKPGDVIELKVRRTGGAADSAVPTPGKESKEVTLKVTLGAKEEWCGPVEFTREKKGVLKQDAGAAFAASVFIERRIQEAGLREPIDRLLAVFRSTVDELGGFNVFPAVREVFRNPHRLPEIETQLSRAFAAAAADPRQVIPCAWSMWGAADDAASAQASEQKALDLTKPGAALQAMGETFTQSAGKLAKVVALNQGDQKARYEMERKQFLQVLAMSAGAGGIDDDEDPRPGIAAMRRSMKADMSQLFAAAQTLAIYMPKSQPPVADAATTQAKQMPTVPIPDELKNAVTGEVLAAMKIDGRWFVYGGFGNNTYDMSVISGVIDPAGDDVYRYPDKALPQVQVIVDMAGNDQYIGESIGPAAGFMGVSLIVDYAGNDKYAGKDLACGAGVMGVGVIVDYDGEDTYTGESWSEGAAIYGFGAIIDLGGKRDEYRAKAYSQAIGGPGGVGLILDQGGDDIYFADGPEPSAYGLAGVRFSMCQGVGFGIRGYDSGGIGLLLDMGGNDRYTAGEFSQGGGYYWGLGIIHDMSGDDVYYANRYSQGFGCHQALGVIDDESGNDTYWATVAASQGAAWDIGMGLLLDRAGNDSYRADGISQGSAAMQGIGWLIDLAGVDQYRSTSTAAQGQGSGNSYHYERTKCGSWSLLLDADGDRDFYSSGRASGKAVTTGEANAKKPEDGTLHGLFISVPGGPGKVDWAK